MPLQQDIQLIVQVQRADGGFDCQGFDNLALTTPLLIAFCNVGSTAAEADMRRLAAACLTELWSSAGARSVDTPCNGRWGGACHAFDEPDCRKLLVIVGDGVIPADPAAIPQLARWIAGDASHMTLPVLPHSARTLIWKLLPAGVNATNASLWSRAAEEAMPAVFATAGITAAQPRIFISYRQVDTAGAADQLFDALSHVGFDVFLDRFRIAPGVNFQARLTQELGDKSMVLLFESPHLLESEWIEYEIQSGQGVRSRTVRAELRYQPRSRWRRRGGSRAAGLYGFCRPRCAADRRCGRARGNAGEGRA